MIVEDERKAAQALERFFRRYRAATVVGSVSEAKALLEEARSWTGLVLDIGLPDGSGIEVADAARKRYPLVPMLVLTGRNDPRLINRSHELRAEFVCKPWSDADLAGFARRAIAFERVPKERLAWVIEELARQCALTPREIDLVAAAVAQDTTRQELREQLGVSENTLKSQVRHLLGKTGHDSLDALTKALLRDALTGGRIETQRGDE